MKPKILLVNPPIYDFAAYDFWLKPYGLLRIAGHLRMGNNLYLFDFLDRLHPAFDPQRKLSSADFMQPPAVSMQNHWKPTLSSPATTLNR